MLLKSPKAYLYLLPAFLVTALFLLGLISGFNESTIGKNNTFSLDAYKNIFTKLYYKESLVLTIQSAVLSTMGSLLIGLFIIFLLYMIQHNRQSRIFQRLSQSPMIIPYIAAGYLFILLIGEHGWISAIMTQTGLIASQDQWPSIIYTKNASGIIITYIWKATPFVVMMLYPLILRVDEGWISMSRILGATRQRAFFLLVLPLLIPTLLICGLLIFAYVFSAFEIPYLLGVTHPKLLAVEAFELYSKGSPVLRPEAFALGIILLIITTLSGILVIKSMEYFNKKIGGGW